MSARWTEVPFGKYKGRTLPQIVLSDPDWFFWAIESEAFQSKGKLAEEAIEVNRKARHIRIPDPNNENLVAQYIIHSPTGKFGKLEIVPMAQLEGEDSGPVYRVIDLSYPRQVANYDKLGCGLLLGAIKSHVFGDCKVRLTRKVCEEFFSNDSNFVLDR